MSKTIHLVVAVILLPLGASFLSAQERTFSFSLSAGLARLSLDQVDEDNQRDVEGWNRQGLLVGSFPSMKNAFMLSLKGWYRYDRDFAFSFSVSRGTREVSASSRTSEQTLKLNRSVGFTDVMVGVLYYVPISSDVVEGYAGAEVGMMYAQANADAYGATTIYDVDVPEQTFVYLETDGAFSAKRTVAHLTLGTSLRVYAPVFLRMEAQYKIGPVGKMNGHVTRIGSEGEETTSIEFDFSGFFFTLGIGVRL